MTFKRALLALLVAAHRLVRGRSTRAPKSLRKVLVIQMAKLGDMVCTTPMFRAIKAHAPDAQVWVMGSALNREILEGNADVDGYIVFIGVWSAIRRLRRERFDAVCIAGAPDVVALAAACLSGVPLVVTPRIEDGFSPHYGGWYRFAAACAATVPHHMGQYAPREYLRLLEPLGISATDTTKRLVYSEAARAYASAFMREHDLQEKKFAIIAPSAGNKIKNWPPDRFARVAEHLVEKGAPVVVIGGKRDAEEVDATMRALQKPERIINALNAFSIDQLKAFIAHAMLFVSADTGPIYIAEAFGVPTVDIVGPVDEREQPPRGAKHVVVASLREAPVIHIMNAHARDEHEARRQVDATTPEMVAVAIDALLRP